MSPLRIAPAATAAVPAAQPWYAQAPAAALLPAWLLLAAAAVPCGAAAAADVRWPAAAGGTQPCDVRGRA